MKIVQSKQFGVFLN